jgi:hypothetical protein
MSVSTPQQDGVFGSEQLATTNDPFNELMFLINSVLGQVNVATLVKVKAVHANTVDVVVLVNQTTGAGQSIPHTTIYGLPFFRLQGGTSSVICDPVINDIGIALFCDRDISSVKNSSLAAPPNSGRRFSFSDGIYIGGWMPLATPTQYIKFLASSILLQTTAVNTPTAYQVNGTQVVTSRQANIPVSTGTLADDTRVCNAILSLLQAHGLMS